MTHRVDFWFDFVSGYSWIAIAEAAEFARAYDVQWRLRPFVLAVAIDHVGRKTIAQVAASRGYAIFDVARHAHRLGLQMKGPPEHPFVSLKALRAQALFQDAPQSLALARALFAAAYEHCRDLTQTDVVLDAVAEAGLPTDGLAERLAAPETKALLRQNTDAAIAAGVFGAPFFFYQGEPFWGQDRLMLLAERIAGRPGLGPDVQQRILSGESEIP